MAPPAIQAGDLVGDRFRVDSEIGSGAEGQVYLATDLKLGSRVCLKVLSGQEGDVARVRFEREARMARRIASPHVVDVYDVGFHGTQPFLVMPALRGQSLAGRLEEGPLGADEAEHIIRGVLRGLLAAHDASVVHRDISPGNVFLREEPGSDWGVPVLLDLGFDTRGTPAYAAPEVRAGGASSIASDIYSTGVLLYLMLSGRLPVRDRKPLHETELLGSTVSRRLSLVAERALSASPDERYQSAGEFLDALDSRLEDLFPGALVNGVYEIEKELGRGACSFVWLARDRETGERRALKFLACLPEQPEGVRRELRRRFEREVKILSSVSHESVVRIFSVDSWGDTPFAVLEYVQGPTLREALPDLGRKAALKSVEQIAGALDAVHAAGVVHRDVKPENIILREGGAAVLIDFGVARLGDVPLTVHGTAGTAGHLAPESLRAEPASAAADQWALAAIAYEVYAGLLPGQEPGEERDRGLISQRVSVGNIEPLPGSVPPHTAQVVVRALSPDPGDRFRSCGEFANALGGVRADRSRWSVRAVTGAAMAAAAATALFFVVGHSEPANSQPPAEVAASPAPTRQQVEIVASASGKPITDVEIDVNGDAFTAPTSLGYDVGDIFVVRVTDQRFETEERTIVVTPTRRRVELELEPKRSRKPSTRDGRKRVTTTNEPISGRQLIYVPGSEDPSASIYTSDTPTANADER